MPRRGAAQVFRSHVHMIDSYFTYCYLNLPTDEMSTDYILSQGATCHECVCCGAGRPRRTGLAAARARGLCCQHDARLTRPPPGNVGAPPRAGRTWRSARACRQRSVSRCASPTWTPTRWARCAASTRTLGEPAGHLLVCPVCTSCVGGTGHRPGQVRPASATRSKLLGSKWVRALPLASMAQKDSARWRGCAGGPSALRRSSPSSRRTRRRCRTSRRTASSRECQRAASACWACPGAALSHVFHGLLHASAVRPPAAWRPRWRRACAESGRRPSPSGPTPEL